MEQFIKIVIEAAARTSGAKVKIRIKKEGEENEPISTPAGRAGSDSRPEQGCILPRHGARQDLHGRGKDAPARRAREFGYMPKVKN